MLPMIIMIIAVFYFLVYRPQKKEQKKMKEMIDTMKKGNKVVTAGGIHGTIAGIKDNVVMVKVYEDVKLEIDKSHITVIKK
ncbi:preprotein translocase subunit YajC [bacterium]|nr:preprotein translocase subunit YajC [bacterium]